MKLYRSYIQTPFGEMTMGATDIGICLFEFEHRKSINAIVKRIESGAGSSFEDGDHQHFDPLKEQVTRYFTGQLKDFTLPLHLIGTPFQISVWEELRRIPYGEVRSYKKQSIALGNEKAIRAVAGANGENGIAIIVPCHRVIGENGSLVGYGGGLPKKKWLLDHEYKFSGKSTQMGLF